MRSQSLDSSLKSCGIDTSNAAQLLTEVGCRIFLGTPAADPENGAAGYERAFQAFHAAALLAPEHPTPVLMQAQVRYRQGRHQEVERLCQRVERMRGVSPRDLVAVLVLRAQSSFVLACVPGSSNLQVRHRLTESLACYRRSLSLDEELCNALEVPQMIARLDRHLRAK